MHFLIGFITKGNLTNLAQKNLQPGAKIYTIFKLS